jgi:hypothetical protein
MLNKLSENKKINLTMFDEKIQKLTELIPVTAGMLGYKVQINQKCRSLSIKIDNNIDEKYKFYVLNFHLNDISLHYATNCHITNEIIDMFFEKEENQIKYLQNVLNNL